MATARGKTPFGKWLTGEMRRLRHTDRSLSEQFRDGVTHTTIGRWRRGEAEPTPKHIDALSQILGAEPRLIYTLLGRITPFDMDGLSSEQKLVIEAVASELNEDEVGMIYSMILARLEQRKSPAKSPAVRTHLATGNS